MPESPSRPRLTNPAAIDLDLDQFDARNLLRLHGRIGQTLRDRGITRTLNNPTGDLAEHLFCRAFGWTQADNSTKSIDAVCAAGVRYQIKGRRVTRGNGSRQLGAIRDLNGGHFDVLAGVVLDEFYEVVRAALIPASVVQACATYVEHTNSSKFILRDEVWTRPGVRDVTETLRAVVF